MRYMSFALTTQQYQDGSKDVTRRNGWLHLKAGEMFMGCLKAMGLKSGEKISPLGASVCVSTRREPLNAITPEDVAREGFPGWTPEQFVAMYCKANKVQPDHIVTRIEFRRVTEAEMDARRPHLLAIGAGA